ncbi:Armadillo [Macleaya cordata]|uniref:RING-type E3 ubiquitin transferase n=1 Tax=Macleaya cordata TaxID=56857 RepID=A0A200Q0U4_MACCD|nr:Armadillo [Macleaya cordata]
MASASIFSSLRRRKSPTTETLLAPVRLSEINLVQTLASLSAELISSFSDRSFPLQRRNSRSLIRKIEIFVVLFEFLRENSDKRLSSTSTLCFKELYLLIYRSKILLDFCSQSSRLWLILQNSSLSGNFHDLNQEISTLLDVFPSKELGLNQDIREQIELLQRQSRKSKLFIDPRDEKLRLRLFEFLDEFEQGRVPNKIDLRSVYIEELGIRDAKSCRAEIEFLEEQIHAHEGDVEPMVSVLNGFVALTRYCRFLLFGLEEEEEETGSGNRKKVRKRVASQEIGETFLTVPKDFCCPISLDLMPDPVTVSTGQTYDRSSIARWMEEGHCSCPKTGQMLTHTRLVPNRALRNLISQWCEAHNIPYDPPEIIDTSTEIVTLAASTKAAIAANKATAELLVQKLSNGSQGAKTIAARELRLLAKTGKENRACIAEAGAIPLLHKLLSSGHPVAQENSVTAILNLSIYDKNKSRIMEEVGCLRSIVEVLRFGLTTEARENAAATLFSLSAVHDYKRRITDEEGAVEALAGLLKLGSPRGKKDAVTALFNLSTHADNCKRMIDAGAITALVGALGTEGVAEEAAGALALLVRQPVGAEAVGKEEMAIAGLIGLMRRGTPRGKENAVAALLELCRSGGAAATQRVARAPALASLLQTLLFTGTKRARRKAASLARVCQRCEAAALPMGRWGVEYSITSNSTANHGSSFAGDVSVPVSFTVRVL